MDALAIKDAWMKYPGRVENDNIHKDFIAGWNAGRSYEELHCPLGRPNLRLREALMAALPTIKRPSHDHPTCDCHLCKVVRQVREALAAE